MNRQFTTLTSRPSAASDSAAASAGWHMAPTASSAHSRPLRSSSHVPYGTGATSAAGGGPPRPPARGGGGGKGPSARRAARAGTPDKYALAFGAGAVPFG